MREGWVGNLGCRRRVGVVEIRRAAQSIKRGARTERGPSVTRASSDDDAADVALLGAPDSPASRSVQGRA